MREADYEAEQVERKRAKACGGGRKASKELQRQQTRRRDRDAGRDLVREYNG